MSEYQLIDLTQFLASNILIWQRLLIRQDWNWHKSNWKLQRHRDNDIFLFFFGYFNGHHVELYTAWLFFNLNEHSTSNYSFDIKSWLLNSDRLAVFDGSLLSSELEQIFEPNMPRNASNEYCSVGTMLLMIW